MTMLRLPRPARLCLVAVTCFVGVARAGDAPVAAPPADNTAYYVIGVFPDDTNLLVSPGTLDAGTFVPSVKPDADNAGHTEMAFLVGKVEGDATLAVTKVLLTDDLAYGTGLIGMLDKAVTNSNGNIKQKPYAACNGAQTLVFQAKAGHVYYIGNMAFSRSARTASLYMFNHIDKARAFLQTRYPALAGRLEQRSYEMHPIKLEYPSYEGIAIVPK